MLTFVREKFLFRNDEINLNVTTMGLLGLDYIETEGILTGYHDIHISVYIYHHTQIICPQYIVLR